ncbi:MAG: valine--tRNA ligase [Mycobacteriales bacterium]
MADAPPATHRQMPDKPTLDGLEAKWVGVWDEQRTYAFDRTATREQIYSIDTPPPTASGTLHIGSAWSYTHADAIARYQRMRGKVVFYPMGWDDNGLPTERRVQNVYGVRCDPSLPYDPELTPPTKPDRKRQVPISRRNFVELCDRLTVEDEKAFQLLWQHLGLSVGWLLLYRTVTHDVWGVSQRGVLRNLDRGEAYQADAPTMWDVTFQSAVAQAEMEDKEQPGAFYRVGFHGTGGPVHIETTRPELLPACVALVAHPDDVRYQRLLGQTVRTPLFDVGVPVVAHRLADPDKGAGIAMICTFGDATDVTWWREMSLPTRAVIGRDGRIVPDTPDWIESDGGRTAYAELAGKTVFSAQKRVLELLGESGDLDGEPKPITHPVKFYERGDEPLEIVTSRQWYITNGGRDADLRDALIARGREIEWHPDFMRHRFENWAKGLTGDWLISRQRFYGVPFPLWYPLDADGEADYSRPITPSEDVLPVDPAEDTPPGFTEDQRGKPSGFIGDPDVLDTWATSSLTPQIAGGWQRDDELFARVFPMDLRPQGHDIIRTWLFDTVLRSHLESGAAPWKSAAISGWIVDPDRKKMGKSTGASTPIDILERFGSDGFRYWACSARLGVDSAVEESQIKVGRRLAVKVLNASKFALGTGVTGEAGEVTEPIDLALVAELAEVVETATAAYDDYNFALALERTETFFWTLCDDYLELVKARAYGEAGEDAARSARATLSVALATVLRLLAPVLPFVTEEVWSWWQDGSVHRAPWPDATEVRDLAAEADASVLTVASRAIRAVRKAKSDAKVSMRTDVAELRVIATARDGELIRAFESDLAAAGRIAQVAYSEPMSGTDALFEVTL